MDWRGGLWFVHEQSSVAMFPDRTSDVICSGLLTRITAMLRSMYPTHGQEIVIDEQSFRLNLDRGSCRGTPSTARFKR